jgi:hypothetical protein
MNSPGQGITLVWSSASDNIPWGEPTAEFGPYSLLGGTYLVREYQDGEFVLVVHQFTEEIESDLGVASTVLQYHSFVNSGSTQRVILQSASRGCRNCNVKP